MSQPPTPASMTQDPATTPSVSSSNIECIFDAALKSYKKKTKKDLKSHDLFKQLETCDSPAAILAVFQSTQFDQSGDDDRLKKWLVPTINVLYAFSGTLGEGVSLVNIDSSVHLTYSDVNSTGVLTSESSLCRRWCPPLGERLRLFPRTDSCDAERSQAAKGVAESQDILVDVFGRIESFFVRLEMYTGVRLTPAMTEKMAQITVEVLDILATATKEMTRGRASEFDLRPFLEANIDSEKFLKNLAGWTDLEDGMKRLEKLAVEEIAMASARLVKVTDEIDSKATKVIDGVRGVEENVHAVQGEVQLVNDNIKVVDNKVQKIAEGG